MKYLYIILVLILIGGGYFAFVQYFSMGGQGETFGTGTSDTQLVQDEVLIPNEQEDAAQATSTQTETVSLPHDSKKSTITLDPNARVFSVKGVNFGYDVKEIVVQEGDTVTINFESTDGFHDIVINEFAVATKRVQPGVKTSATFVADKKGTFEYYCSVGSHRDKGMVGKLIVQ